MESTQMSFKPGDLVRVLCRIKINGTDLSGSIGLVVGLEDRENEEKYLNESLNRELPYIIIARDIQTYVWESEIERLEVE